MMKVRLCDYIKEYSVRNKSGENIPVYEDYRRRVNQYIYENGDTPFGLLVRRVGKLDHEAAIEAFSSFINDESLNQKQIAFIHKIINHTEPYGYMESVTDLQKPPFDKPASFINLFDRQRRQKLISILDRIKENTTETIA